MLKAVQTIFEVISVFYFCVYQKTYMNFPLEGTLCSSSVVL